MVQTSNETHLSFPSAIALCSGEAFQGAMCRWSEREKMGEILLIGIFLPIRIYIFFLCGVMVTWLSIERHPFWRCFGTTPRGEWRKKREQNGWSFLGVPPGAGRGSPVRVRLPTYLPHLDTMPARAAHRANGIKHHKEKTDACAQRCMV